MAGRQAIGAKLAREGDQVDELHALVARRAGHRRPAGGIFVDEAVDHAVAEAAFIIEHVMGDAEPVGDHLRVIDVLARAAGARSAHRFAMIVELQGDADHLGAGARGERGRDRAVDAAGHGNDDSGIAQGAAELKIDPQWRSLASIFTRISLLAPRPEASRRQRGGQNWRVSRRTFDGLTKRTLSLDELLDLLAVTGDGGGRKREDAIACYLSGSEGWRDAVKSLGGAFAEEESGLKERKAD